MLTNTTVSFFLPSLFFFLSFFFCLSFPFDWVLKKNNYLPIYSLLIYVSLFKLTNLTVSFFPSFRFILFCFNSFNCQFFLVLGALKINYLSINRFLSPFFFLSVFLSISFNHSFIIQFFPLHFCLSFKIFSLTVFLILKYSYAFIYLVMGYSISFFIPLWTNYLFYLYVWELCKYLINNSPNCYHLLIKTRLIHNNTKLWLFKWFTFLFNLHVTNPPPTCYTNTDQQGHQQQARHNVLWHLIWYVHANTVALKRLHR